MRTRIGAAKAFVVVLALGATAAACTSNPAGSSSAEGTPESPISQFLDAMRATKHDYEPADTPDALARRADVVIDGEIVGVAAGQSYAPAPEAQPEIATSVLKVQVYQVLGGADALVADGYVYVELPHPAYVSEGPEENSERVPFDREAFAATVPRTRTILFLGDRTTEPYWPNIIDEGAGRPEGAPLTTPYTQGFLIEDEGKLVSVLEPLEAMPDGWEGFESLESVVGDINHAADA